MKSQHDLIFVLRPSFLQSLDGVWERLDGRSIFFSFKVSRNSAAEQNIKCVFHTEIEDYGVYINVPIQSPYVKSFFIIPTKESATNYSYETSVNIDNHTVDISDSSGILRISLELSKSLLQEALYNYVYLNRTSFSYPIFVSVEQADSSKYFNLGQVVERGRLDIKDKYPWENKIIVKEGFVYMTSPKANDSLTLVFNDEQFDDAQIAEILAEIADLYEEISGDELVIDSISSPKLEQLTPVEYV